MRKRAVTFSVTVLAAAMLLAAVAISASVPTTVQGRAKGAVEEAQEQREVTEQRLVALQASRQAGTLGITERIRRAPAPGWAGEVVLNATGDDWEPAIAADPTAPWVYVMHNRYGGTPACASNCPDPAMIVRVSSNGGQTFGPERFLCTCKKVGGQFDPLVEVVPNTGDVYAVWMNDFNIRFAKSTDHGATWSAPVDIDGKVSWGDKPNFATSADGQHIYVHFNGPTNGDVYSSVSHDAGATWTVTRLTNSTRYHFAYGTAVLPSGRALSSQISFSYTGPGGAAEGPVEIHVFASNDGGATWSNTVVDTLELGTQCESEGCYADFYDSGPALAMDADGDLVLVYSGASTSGGPRTVYARSSTNDGLTWSARTALSPAGANAAFAAATGVGDDGARVYYADQSTGRWNVWYRSTSNLGGSWSTPVKISDATSGAVYKNASGFVEFYGDYGEIDVTSAGKTVAIWAEGESYFGPGGIWFNRET